MQYLGVLLIFLEFYHSHIFAMSNFLTCLYWWPVALLEALWFRPLEKDRRKFGHARLHRHFLSINGYCPPRLLCMHGDVWVFYRTADSPTNYFRCLGQEGHHVIRLASPLVGYLL